MTGSRAFISCADSRTATSLLTGHPVEQRHDLLDALGVEIGQRLVEQQELRAADQCVGDQDPLLLPAREAPDPGVGESVRRRRRGASCRRARAAPSCAGRTRSGARRGRAPPGRGRASGCRGRAGPSGARTRASVAPRAVSRPSTRTGLWSGRWSPRMTRRSVVLPDPVGTDEPGELALAGSRRRRRRAPFGPQNETPTPSTSRTEAAITDAPSRFRGSTAALIAATSASIQDW